ncbi:hypothetical protein C9374_003865 [Naegleria lovaniensis]|uniref:Uncharacterized protein n=1 Tax=Naegleria lovaniensis TaxID=51637 RepID=A0AA88KSF2_NAELO|nr:uncharacterized protein C9374_003865 [Naegleria lovaniensis]KAG2394101.1 hypothetical protein C9374_003865 [Naegleria lovaniensis]
MTSSRSNVTSTPNKSSLPSKTSPVSSNNSGSVLTPSVALNRIQPSATSRPSSSQSNSSSTVTSITSKVKSPTTSKTPLNNTGSTNSNASNISTNVGQGSLKRTPSKQENSKISASSSSINATPITSPPPLVRSDSNSSLKSSTSTTSNTSLNTMPSNRNDEKEATILVKQMEGLKSRLEREKQELDRLVAEKELEIRSHISAHQDKADDIKAELFKLERTKEVHEKTVEMLTKEKMELEHNMDSLKSELKRTLASLHSAQIENSTLKNELDAVEERCTSQVEILNNDLKRKQQQVGQLQAEKEQLEYRVQALQSELLHQLSSETDQEKMAILENTISLLENEKKSLKSQFETLRNSYDADTRNLANERDSIMKELVFSNNQIALNIEEIEKAKHRYTLLEQELFNSKQESSSMIDLLKDEIRTKSEQIEELSNELSSLKNLSLEGEERSNEMSSLLSTISTLTIENNAIQQQLHELKERNMDMAKQLEFKEEIIEEEKTTVQRLTANIEELKTMLKELEGSLRIENNLKEQLAFTLATEQKSREITEASVRESAQYISDLEEKLSQEISSKQSLIEFYEVRIAQLQNDFDRLDTLKRESENQVAKTQSENNILQEQLLNEIEGSALLKINMEKSEERILLLEQTFKSQLEVISHNEKLLKQEVETLNETLRRERSTVESLRNSLVTEVSAQKYYPKKFWI